ncbi:hypothetical protein BD413DRAFT_564499 [Trametes elegans]|nr:hypothetical protein BD413DRAFT_564499 [Trametes elegans]
MLLLRYQELGNSHDSPTVVWCGIRHDALAVSQKHARRFGSGHGDVRQRVLDVCTLELTEHALAIGTKTDSMDRGIGYPLCVDHKHRHLVCRTKSFGTALTEDPARRVVRPVGTVSDGLLMTMDSYADASCLPYERAKAE